MFRQFIKKEDISHVLPPPPPRPAATSVENYDRSTKMLFNYVRNGPMSALAAQNVNTAAPPSKPGGLAVGVSPPKSRPPPHVAAEATSARYAPAPAAAAAPGGHVRSQTPTQKSSSRLPSPSRKNSASPVPSQAAKRAKIEWPAHVPTNKALYSTSRSKVQHLTAQRVAAQESVDPDLIFHQNVGDLPLAQIFASCPSALKSVADSRNASGDWRHDTFTREEEAQYKSELGYKYIGPSQSLLECVTVT